MTETSDDIFECKEQIGEGISIALFALKDLPPSREASLVRTKLDEARMWLDEVSDDIPTTG